MFGIMPRDAKVLWWDFSVRRCAPVLKAGAHLSSEGEISMAQQMGRYQRVKALLHKETTSGYVFAAPFIVGFLAFTIIPMIYSFYISFTDYRIFAEPVWIGLDNYIRLFTSDPRVVRSVTVTLYYVLV